MIFLIDFFIWGVSLTHPVLDSFLSGEFLLHIPSRFDFYLGNSLTHPVLASFLCIPCLLFFSLFFSLTHLVLASVLSLENKINNK